MTFFFKNGDETVPNGRQGMSMAIMKSLHTTRSKKTNFFFEKFI